MPDYRYLAVSPDGKRIKASVEATDFEAAKKVIKNQGLTLIELNEANILNKEIHIGKNRRPNLRDLAVFCRQMSSILQAGIPLARALLLLTDQVSNKAMKEGLKDVTARVEKGDTLAYAMSHNEKIFPAMMTSLIQAGEASGSLEVSFDRLALNLEKRARIAAMIKKSMIYPAVILTVSLIVIVIMSVAVAPKFASMFNDMGGELPLITRMLMNFSHLLLNWWFLMLIIAAAIVSAFKLWLKTERGRHLWGKFTIKVIIFGKLNLKSSCAGFARTLSTLTDAGMDLPQALDLTAESMTNVLFKDAIIHAKSEVEQGVLLSETLRKSGIFPRMVTDMVAVGEEIGNIEGLLGKVADYYEEETEMMAASLNAAMEPLIIAVLGVIVGTIVFALYQPMVSMYDNMGNI